MGAVAAAPDDPAIQGPSTEPEPWPEIKLNKTMKTFRLLGFLLGMAALGPSCGHPSEEARITKFMKETIALAEKRDLGAVMERLAEDYTDFEGRDKTATEALIRDYFRRTGIVIHLLSTKVDAIEADGRASVRAEAMLSSGAAEVFRKLIRYAGDYYRFNIRLRATPPATWQIVSASWESVPLTELFPESLAVLKKLFPEF